MGLLEAVAASLTIYSAAINFGDPSIDPQFNVSQWSTMGNCKATVNMIVDNEKQLSDFWTEVDVRQLKDGEYGRAIKRGGRYREFICRELR